MNRDELLSELAARIDGVRRDHPVRVAIDGVDAAGKTTLADQLVEPLEAMGRSVIRASIDGFHAPASARWSRGLESSEGYYRDSFDYAGLIENLLEPLGPGGSRRYRRAVFDFRSDSPVDAPREDAVLDSILIFDGVFLLRRELRRYWDFSVLVQADFQITMTRAEERDLELFGSKAAVRLRYRRRYIPGQRLYFCEEQPERRASIVINNDNPSQPRITRADEKR